MGELPRRAVIFIRRVNFGSIKFRIKKAILFSIQYF